MECTDIRQKNVKAIWNLPLHINTSGICSNVVQALRAKPHTWIKIVQWMGDISCNEDY